MIARTTQTSFDDASGESASPLGTLDDIARLVSENGDPAETLSNIVGVIRQRFATDVSSVYLLEADRMTLVLAATIGLRPESVGRVRMRITEGLAGLVAQRLQVEVVADAARHPRFRVFRRGGGGRLSNVPRGSDRRSRAASRGSRPSDPRAARVLPRGCAHGDAGGDAAGADPR